MKDSSSSDDPPSFLFKRKMFLSLTWPVVHKQIASLVDHLSNCSGMNGIPIQDCDRDETDGALWCFSQDFYIILLHFFYIMMIQLGFLPKPGEEDDRAGLLALCSIMVGGPSYPFSARPTGQSPPYKRSFQNQPDWQWWLPKSHPLRLPLPWLASRWDPFKTPEILRAGKFSGENQSRRGRD